MSSLSKELDRYLTIRRSLGYDLGTTERNLRKFITFAQQENAEYISTALFLRWQEAFGNANKQTWGCRLGMVRVFAQWLHCVDPKHEVPPQSLIPNRIRRARPYIYSEDEIRRIVSAAAELPSANGIRSLSVSTLFGLIAVTGLRVSEALSFDTSDIDPDCGVLTLRRGKLGKAPATAGFRVRLPDYGSLTTSESATGFSARLRNRSLYRISVSASAIAAPGTTSQSSASLSDCARLRSLTGMDEVHAFMTSAIRSRCVRC